MEQLTFRFHSNGYFSNEYINHKDVMTKGCKLKHEIVRQFHIDERGKK